MANEGDVSIFLTAQTANNMEHVLLATAVVQVIGPNNQTVLARILPDSTSMTNFVSEELIQNLQLK